MAGNAASRELISVIIPCRNEAEFIEPFLRNILSQRRPAGRGVEFLLVDGMSDDGTRERLDDLAVANPEIRLVDNPRRTSPAAMNVGLAAASGSIVVRMDVHIHYADDYIDACVAALESTGADNVGGPWVVRGSGYLTNAIALSFSGWLVSGGGKAHDPSYQGPVDTVCLGCWRREFLLKMGGFDEELVRNSDDELNLRIRRAGGKLWQTPEIRLFYHPRQSLGLLFRQYMQYGFWKVRVIQKQKMPASPRHLVPGAFVLTLLLLFVLAPFSSRMGQLLGLTLLIYSTVLVGAAVAASLAARQVRYLPVLPVVIAVFHIGYGYGFLRGVIAFLVRRRGIPTTERFTGLTRGRGSRPQR